MPPPKQYSIGRLGLVIFAIVSLVLGAYYRFPGLGERPMHTDEAILAMKSAEFQTTGHFQYDPKDFHGPGLHYIARTWGSLAGWGDPLTWTEAQLRTVPVICSLLLLLSTLLLSDALGRRGTGMAMLLMSISPMMVYYSRYFIMEVPLVMFITLTISSLWRYSQGGGRWWLIVAGFALGMQHATKETFAINVVAAICGYGVAKLMLGEFAPRRSGFQIGPKSTRAAKPWLWVLGAALLTSVAIYSGGFKDWQAVKDSAMTYLNYFERAGGSGHEKPWHYYITLIFWRKDGLTWSEAMIGGLGIVGMLHAFFGNHMKHPARQAFLVFLSVYTLVLIAIYSFLAYKTPWSILSAQHALTLLAGSGASAISKALTGKISRTAFKVAFGVGMYQLIAQTNLAIHLYAADSRNPYVYAHTSSNLMRLRPQLRELQNIAPDDNFNVLVINRDEGWPLPWYWRDIKSVEYRSTIPAQIDARVIVAESEMQSAIEAKFDGETYRMQGPFGLRPGVLLNMWVEQSLWDRYKLRKEQEEAAP